MWVYIISEPNLYAVGFYTPQGVWNTDSDHDSREDAAERVAWLNGGGRLGIRPTKYRKPHQNLGGRPEKYPEAKEIVFRLREKDQEASGVVIWRRLRAHAQARGWEESDLPRPSQLDREGRTVARWIQEFDRRQR